MQQALMTKDESNERKKTEEKIRGNGLPEPPLFLTEKQVSVFYGIVKGLADSEILGELDSHILAQAAVSIDRLQFIEGIINEEPSKVLDKDLMSAKDKYTKDFFRCCNELCLSPQSRAKMALTAYKNKTEKNDPLAGIFEDIKK